ncbi:aromatic amino acid lyase, partial [Candidatus Fermentibacterales bacterium]|nr:aromatic amino acid lyase [Candidatus Fermentibacterales bacterium]
HLSLPLIGEGECVGEADHSGTEHLSGLEALRLLGRDPLTLQAKEGLALINGTQGMTSVLALALLDCLALADACDAAASMSVEALLATDSAFDPELISLRPHPGAERVAANLRLLTSGSGILESHRGCDRVQDAYSLRCSPQVHGACRDAMAYVRGVLDRELVSVTDNPLLMSDGRVLSGGNFHGEPVALAADHLALAACELASISERRIERLLNPDLSGMPAFLSPSPGTNSGLMIAQYSAASLVSENRAMAHPASVDNIPVSASQEDHVSMGMISARKAAMSVENARRVVATELLAGAQALDLMGRSQLAGSGVREVYSAVRGAAAPLGDDRRIDMDIDAVEGLVADGVFSRIVEGLRRDL